MKRGNIGDHRERTAFVRECVAHYEPMLLRPTEEQYTAIARALLGLCPTLRDSETHYWVSFYCMATTILSLLLVTDIKYRYYYLNIVHMSGTDCMGYFSTCLSHYIHTCTAIFYNQLSDGYLFLLFMVCVGTTVQEMWCDRYYS